MQQNRHKTGQQDPVTGSAASLETLLANPPGSVEELLAGMSLALYESLREAVALGKWPDGSSLSRQQIENSLQLLILYEQRHVPEARRTFNTLPRGCGAGPGPRSIDVIESEP